MDAQIAGQVEQRAIARMGLVQPHLFVLDVGAGMVGQRPAPRVGRELSNVKMQRLGHRCAVLPKERSQQYIKTWPTRQVSVAWGR
jgi:hypothetical protein